MADQRVNNEKRKKKINFYKFVGKVEDQPGIVSVGNDKVVDALNNLGTSVNTIASQFEQFKTLSAKNFLAQSKIEKDNKRRDKPALQKKKRDPFGGMVLGGIAALVAKGAGSILDLLGGMFKLFVLVPLLQWMSKEENREKLQKIIAGVVGVAKFLFDVTSGIVMTTLDLIAGFTEMPFWKEILKGGLFLIALGTGFLAFKKLFGGKAIKFVVKMVFRVFKGFFKSLVWFSKKLLKLATSKGLRKGLGKLFGSKAGKALLFTGVTVGTGMAIDAFTKDGVSGKDLEKTEEDITDDEKEQEAEIEGLTPKIQSQLDQLTAAFGLATDAASGETAAGGPASSIGGTQDAAEPTGQNTGSPQPATEPTPPPPPPANVQEYAGQQLQSLGRGVNDAIRDPKQALSNAREGAGNAINFAKKGFGNILGGKSFFDQEEQSTAMPKLATGGSLRGFANGGIIQGPQTGYPVSLDGGASTSFIGHGTEMVYSKPGGSSFVVPYDTPATRGNKGLTERRHTEAQRGGFLGYSKGGKVLGSEGKKLGSTEKAKINQEQDKFGGDGRGSGVEPRGTGGGGAGPVSGEALFNPKIIQGFYPKGTQKQEFEKGGAVDDAAPKPESSGVDAGKAILQGAKSIIGKKRGVGDMCAFTTRAALAAAGHSFSEKRTQKGDLDTPKGLKYSGRNFAASFAGTDMGTVKTSRSDVTAGDVILWRDYAGGRYGKGAVTHVGIAATDGLTHQFDHNKTSGWHRRPHWGRSHGTEWFAGISLGGASSGAKIDPATGKSVETDSSGGKSSTEPVSIESLIANLGNLLLKGAHSIDGDKTYGGGKLTAATFGGKEEGSTSGAGTAAGNRDSATGELAGGKSGFTGTGGATGSENEKALLNAIADAEGTTRYPNKGYNTQYTGKQFTGKNHPRQILGPSSLRSDAAGRYQFLSTTWDSVMGDPITPERQDKGALKLTSGRGVGISNGLSLAEIYKLGGEWASIEGGPQMKKGGGYGGQAKYSAETFLGMYEKYGGKPQMAQGGPIKLVRSLSAGGAAADPTAPANFNAMKELKKGMMQMKKEQDFLRAVMNSADGRGNYKNPRTGGNVSRGELDKKVKAFKANKQRLQALHTKLHPKPKSTKPDYFAPAGAITGNKASSFMNPGIGRAAVQPSPVKLQTKKVAEAKTEVKSKANSGVAALAAVTQKQNTQAQKKVAAMSKPIPDKPVRVPVPKGDGGGGRLSSDDIYNYRPGFGLFAGGF